MQDVDTMCLLFKTGVMPTKIFAFKMCLKWRAKFTAAESCKILVEQMGLDPFALAVGVISS